MCGGGVGLLGRRRRKVLWVGAWAVRLLDGDGDLQFLRWTIVVEEYSHGH